MYENTFWVFQEPTLEGLKKTVIANLKSRNSDPLRSSDALDGQMLWILWRHITRTERQMVGQDTFCCRANSSIDLFGSFIYSSLLCRIKIESGPGVGRLLANLHKMVEAATKVRSTQMTKKVKVARDVDCSARHPSFSHFTFEP